MTSVHLPHGLDGLQRLRRRFGFDGNDLRRATDRRQRAVGLAAAVSFAGIAPPLCAGVVSLTYRSGLGAEAAQAATHRLVDARVTRIETQTTGQMRYSFAVLAWTTPDGQTHWATVPAKKAAGPGAIRRVWVDASGEMTRRPQSRSDTVMTAAFAGAATTVAAGAVPFSAYMLVRRRCDRRRARMWDVAWARLDRRQMY
ncbi:Rv1733c family protein [Actinomadura nitritigenes]|uniref:Rv1733c family protein n=1 Tax=Actinomadura nitritigenes TaxID=134602 RepID=UPI003D8BF7AF